MVVAGWENHLLSRCGGFSISMLVYHCITKKSNSTAIMCQPTDSLTRVVTILASLNTLVAGELPILAG